MNFIVYMNNMYFLEIFLHISAIPQGAFSVRNRGTNSGATDFLSCQHKISEVQFFLYL